MLFQVLDDKEECVTVCIDGKIVRDPSFANLTKTWRWLPSIGEAVVDCAFLYVNGKGLNDLCPEDLKEEWNTLLKKFAAFNTAFKEAIDGEQIGLGGSPL